MAKRWQERHDRQEDVGSERQKKAPTQRNVRQGMTRSGKTRRDETRRGEARQADKVTAGTLRMKGRG